MYNQFIMDLLAGLDKQNSKKQINADIKQLEKLLNKINLIGTFSKENTKKELNTYITQLTNQLSYIKLQAKLDNKKLQREINESLKNISFSDINVNVDENRTKIKVQKVVAEAKSIVDKNPLSLNIEIKKEKLSNQLTAFLNKNSKVRESTGLLEEADKLRKKFSNIGDKNSLKNAADQFQLFKSEVTATGFAGQSTTDKIKSMVSNITKIGTAFGVASTAINQFSQSERNLKEIDTVLTEISKTSEMTKRQLVELGDASFDTANKYGQLAKNYLLGVQEMARSGYEEKAKELGEVSLLAQSAGDMTAEMANNYILATDAAYKYSGSIEKLTSALDGANYVSNKNSASLTDIADGIRVSASYAANAGVQIEQLTAAEATMIATTKRSGSEMGRAFRSILLNLQQVSGEFDGEVIDEESLKKVESRCHTLGVELETLKNGVTTLRNPMEILKELSQVYNSLPESSADKQGLISDLGGKYHANALTALLSRWDLYEKMLSEYSQGAGSTLVEANKTADSWEGRLNQLQNSWDSFINSLTNKDVVKGGISFLDETIQTFEKLTDTIGTIPTLMTAINASMSALNKDYGITQLFNQDAGKMDIQGNFMGIDFTAFKAQKKHFEEAAEAIEKWNAELLTGQTDLNKFAETIVKNSTQFKSYLQTCSVDAPASLAGYKSYLNAAGVSTDALRLKTVLLTSAMSLGIGFAIQAVISGISKMIRAQEEARQSAQDAANAYVESASSIEEYAKKYKELHSALLKAKGNEEETYNIKKQLLDLQTELNDKYGDEYSKLNLVTEAYKDQTDAIKVLNKENANKFLNENESAINKAENQMTKQHHYNLSYTGISKDADNNKDLLDIAKKYENKGIELLKDTEGLFSIHLSADATDAENVIQSFMTDIRAKAKELGNEHLFDDVLEISNSSLSDAQETIEKYGEIYNQALFSQIATDPTGKLQDGYNNALRAVEAYNEAVLRSENPYNDENVKKAYDNLQTVRAGIIDNGEEWNKYASIMDDVWSSADTKVYDLNSAINSNQDGIGQFIDKLNGIEDIDLGAKIDSKDSDVYNDLSKYADKYNMTIEELVNSLVKLGYVQTNISDNIIEDSPINLSISSTIDQLNTQLKPAFDSLKSAYQNIFTDGGFTLENVDLSMLDSIKSKIDDMSELGLNVDTSSFENLARVLSDSSSTAYEVQGAFDSLASSFLNNTDIIENLDDNTVQLVASMLESLGVANAEEIVYDSLNAKTEALALQKQFAAQTGTELINATNDEIAAFLNHAGASETARQYLFQLVAAEQVFNAQGLDVDGKILKLKVMLYHFS